MIPCLHIYFFLKQQERQSDKVSNLAVVDTHSFYRSFPYEHPPKECQILEDSARYTVLNSQRNFCYFDMLGVKHWHTRPRLNVSSGRQHVLVMFLKVFRRGGIRTCKPRIISLARFQNQAEQNNTLFSVHHRSTLCSPKKDDSQQLNACRRQSARMIHIVR